MNINYKTVIEEIHKSQKQTIVPLPEFRSKKSLEILPAKSRGLYWLWCKTDFSKITLEVTAAKSAHVPLDVLFNNRTGLKHVCDEKEDGFRIVYNGMGGYKTWGPKSTYGLRGRINQECISNNTKTGTLNIEGRGLSVEDWKVSYFDFDDPKNKVILKLLDPKLNITGLYQKMGNTLEILWRLHYGIPIFCRY